MTNKQIHIRQMIEEQEHKIHYLISTLQHCTLQRCMTKKQTIRLFEQEIKHLELLRRQYKSVKPCRVTFVET
jgi:5-bromo-4-chloroindolyl phosphate hydrolysis protein